MEIVPLPQGFGAEVIGFDLAGGESADDIARLQSAHDRYHLLVFRRGPRLSPARQAQIAGWFGPLGGDGAAPGQPWSFMDNRDAAGRAVLKFHCDMSPLEHPVEGISLHAVELPRVPTSTTFVSNALAWDALEPALQDELRGMKGLHHYGEAINLAMRWPMLEHWHPVCLLHPRTGRELLFVTEYHTIQLGELPAERNAALLEQLFGLLYAPAMRYEHTWELGDLLIWDSLAVQHARTREADPADGPRVLQRVSLGTHSIGSQIAARAREQGIQPTA